LSLMRCPEILLKPVVRVDFKKLPQHSQPKETIWVQASNIINDDLFVGDGKKFTYTGANAPLTRKNLQLQSFMCEEKPSPVTTLASTTNLGFICGRNALNFAVCSLASQ